MQLLVYYVIISFVPYLILQSTSGVDLRLYGMRHSHVGPMAAKGQIACIQNMASGMLKWW